MECCSIAFLPKPHWDIEYKTNVLVGRQIFGDCYITKLLFSEDMGEYGHVLGYSRLSLRYDDFAY